MAVEWKEEALSVTFNNIAYTSNYTPYKPGGLTKWPLRHNGEYLKLSRGTGLPNQAYFHRQLYNDQVQQIRPGCVVQHKDHSKTNNNLSNLQMVLEPHTAQCTTLGGPKEEEGCERRIGSFPELRQGNGSISKAELTEVLKVVSAGCS
ncbi:unnamed protein product [Durusdinium trenchii]|uniref:Uncharacterized protein n=2 Tax=Durusdinium trenchii TaxID=1381693 RepID=A0ABP0QUF1_9DINO